MATHQFAATASATITHLSLVEAPASAVVGAKIESAAALASAQVHSGSGTIVLVDVLSEVAAGPQTAPDGPDTGIGDGDSGQGGLGQGGAPDAPDAETGGLGTAAVGVVYQVEANVVLQGAGTQLAVRDFVFTVPPGALGSSFSATLADPHGTLDEEDRLRVRIGLFAGAVVEHLKLAGGMRVTSLERQTGYLSDQVRITAVNPMADVYARSPRVPLVLYDPDQTTLVSLTETVARDIVDSDRNVLEPQFRAVAGLDLLQLMQFVYVEKCGFSAVVTNIPNFPLKRCDFQIEAPWSAVVNSEIGAFSPIFGCDDDDVLYILDPQGTLPDDLLATIKKLKPRSYSNLNTQQETGGMVNAVLLNYRDNTGTAGAFNGSETDRFESEAQEVGSSGTIGWQRTTVGRFIKDFHDNPADPTDVTRSIPWKTETRVQTVTGEISIETTTEFWTSDWRLRVGWEKIMQILTALPGPDYPAETMRECQRERGTTVWAASKSNPGEYHKQWETIVVTGTVLWTDVDPGAGGADPSRVTLYDAARAGRVEQDQSVTPGAPISTTTERFRTIANDQIEMTHQKIGHLQGKPESNRTYQHTGTNAVRTSPQGREGVTARMLLTIGAIPDEEARPPLQFNAGNIPYDLARPLAQRLLDRRGAQPITVNFTLAGLDLTLRRGSLRRVFLRDGTILRTFITGYTVTGSPGPRGSIVLSMSGQGVVIG